MIHKLLVNNIYNLILLFITHTIASTKASSIGVPSFFLIYLYMVRDKI